MNLVQNSLTRISTTHSSVLVRGICVHGLGMVANRLFSSKSWLPIDEEEMKRTATTALKHQYTEMQLKTAETLIPWFLNEMPASYFRSVAPEDRLQHLRAISALRSLESEADELRVLTAVKEEERTITFARIGHAPGTLLRQVKQLSAEAGRLSEVQVFTSRDDALCLNSFKFQFGYNNKNTQQNIQGTKFTQHLEYAKEHGILNADEEEMKKYFNKCDPGYLAKVSSARFFEHRNLVEKASGGLHAFVEVRKADEPRIMDTQIIDTNRFWIQIAVPCIRTRGYLGRVLKVFGAAGHSVDRCHLTDIGDVTMLQVLVTPAQRNSEIWTNIDGTAWTDACHLLQRLKWLDDAALDLALSPSFRRAGEIRFSGNAVRQNFHPLAGLPTPADLDAAELLAATTAIVHTKLARADAVAYSSESIVQIVTRPRYLPIARAAVDRIVRASRASAIDDQGLPLCTERELALMEEEDAVTTPGALKMRANDATAGVDAAAGRVLNALIDTTGAVRNTNLDRILRCGIAMNLDPKAFLHIEDSDIYHHMPYGIIYVHARRLGGFHVRFKRIARGGMRIVTPRSADTMQMESGRHFDECYNLAFAQQLKNKDLAEGGSKGVLIVNALTDGGQGDDGDENEKEGETLHHYVCRQAVKAYTDGLLDLSLPSDTTSRGEYLYLGPDEQIIPQDIQWVVDNAQVRGHPVPAAFMSSKAETGINHKEFGVTSEGVIVYLDTALRASGKDPSTASFTIKITGGPDGDVAGNLIKMLHRDYGQGAKIVGIADGSGCAEDSDGLDHEELLRLVDASEPILSFNADKLSARGHLYDAGTDEGAARRDSMHNRIIADVFVPAGGRPNTINEHNFRAFLQPDGRPSSPLVVEGANLFITPNARTALYRDAGVRVVKDSSANKAGVICSSFEILAAHLIDAEDFDDTKPILVSQVILRLKQLAQLEANLLFREFSRHPAIELPVFSTRISQAINDVTDAVIAKLEQNKTNDSDKHRSRHNIELPAGATCPYDLFVDLAHDHLPKVLAEYSTTRADRLPHGYVESAVASFVASRLVYAEGLSFVETLPADRVAEVALNFVDAQRKTKNVVQAVKDAPGLDDANREVIIKLLDRGGARAALDL
mmetsp:Transcript_8356/g.11638  ORF Transcript_8356/g.11638 Transcript_8356/m.11638 type:complete len:1119 (-) Transcript_8356:263-3619(-)|eukprot:CAMPEP_0197337122 /NCGR_PEP_ID=MMETSP0892-20130614/37782_1 /TAXON_ID=44058 ORGANISM="Aureoumbra lagunensis, Strain CCMP1510" /NCGR_SAMPLE_ID=MMETSP0892 /ASSEMBLY_ACC=CAM_ASM_000538 /LENGTH=1118 /DNA_ID=CAMNT_0042839699 /DNA_START=1 /DNA_END=3357 /DNA_ORIENTATION=+